VGGGFVPFACRTAHAAGPGPDLRIYDRGSHT
jgi:hypothetical protein